MSQGAQILTGNDQRFRAWGFIIYKKKNDVKLVPKSPTPHEPHIDATGSLFDDAFDHVEIKYIY
jgi:hypothetical protein